VPTRTNTAFVYSGFYGADEGDRADVRALSMASRILSTRMIKEVREDAQLVYSIGAAHRAATTYPGFGVFSAAAPTDPEKVPALVAKLSSMYDEFAKNGPSEDEVNIAKKQYETTWTASVKEPAFWAGALNQIDFRGRTLDEILAAPDEYKALPPQQVKD